MIKGIADSTVDGFALELEAARRMGDAMFRSAVRLALEWSFEQGRRSVIGDLSDEPDEEGFER